MHSWLKMQLVRPRLSGTSCSTSESGARKDGLDFGQIYTSHFELAWRALRRYGVPPEELEDGLQEVFLTVHDRLHTFEGRSSLRTWIYGIARRIAREHRPNGRLEICQPRSLDELPAHGSLDEGLGLEQREDAQLLDALLAELSEDRREVLVLVELEQLTVAEASEVLGENPNTLQSRLKAARMDLSSAWAKRIANEDWRRGCRANNRR